MFIVAQLAGAAATTALILAIHPRVREVADQVIVPHEPTGSLDRR